MTACVRLIPLAPLHAAFTRMLAPPFAISEAGLDEGLEVIDAALAVADELERR